VLLVFAVICPLPWSFVHPAPSHAAQVLDRTGQLLYEVRPEDSGSSQFLALSDMPKSFVQVEFRNSRS
jgi:hypothetical protein